MFPFEKELEDLSTQSSYTFVAQFETSLRLNSHNIVCKYRRTLKFKIKLKFFLKSLIKSNMNNHHEKNLYIQNIKKMFQKTKY